MPLFLIAVAGCSAYSKPDYEYIQGKWNAQTIRNGGKDVPTEGSGMEFAAGRLTNLKDGDPTGPFGSYRLDENKQPKWLDIHDDKRNLDIVGIYQLEGDTLTICLNEQAKSDAERPTTFTSESGSNQIVMQLRRRAK